MGTSASMEMSVQLALHRLTSPALPVGAFSYSRGLEHAVELGWVCDERSALSWIDGVLRHAVGPLDGAVFVRLHRAFEQGCSAAVARWNAHLDAARESRELQQEERQMGAALQRLLSDLSLVAPGELPERCGFVTAFALAAVRSQVPLTPALAGLLFTLCEAQVSAVIRLVPLGQTAGQRISIALQDAIEAAVHEAVALSDDEIGNAAPGLAMASAGHETQYSRLFRS